MESCKARNHIEVDRKGFETWRNMSKKVITDYFYVKFINALADFCATFVHLFDYLEVLINGFRRGYLMFLKLKKWTQFTSELCLKRLKTWHR